MKISIKTPTLDLEIDDVKKLEDVVDFVAAIKKLEAESVKQGKRPAKKQ